LTDATGEKRFSGALKVGLLFSYPTSDVNRVCGFFKKKKNGKRLPKKAFGLTI